MHGNGNKCTWQTKQFVYSMCLFFSQGFYTWYFYQIFSSSICFPHDGTTSDVDAGDLLTGYFQSSAGVDVDLNISPNDLFFSTLFKTKQSQETLLLNMVIYEEISPLCQTSNLEEKLPSYHDEKSQSFLINHIFPFWNDSRNFQKQLLVHWSKLS